MLGMLDVERKAVLVAIGNARIEPALLPEALATTATAGPGAGGRSFFIRSGNHRVRLGISDQSLLQVIPEGDGVAAVLDRRVIARGCWSHPSATARSRLT